MVLVKLNLLLVNPSFQNDLFKVDKKKVIRNIERNSKNKNLN